MVKFPLKFEVEATSTCCVSTPWTSRADEQAPIPSAIPPEFMGPGTGYSPEDLFALAVLNCIIATFKVYCEHGKMTFREIHGRAVAHLDRQHNEQTLLITHIEIHLDVKGASQPDKVKQILENAIRDCAISHSIKSGKTFHINVS